MAGQATHTHRVSPDIKHWLGCSDDSADEGPDGHADPKLELVKGVFVDVLQLVVHLGAEVYQVTQVVELVLRLSWKILIEF